MLCINNILKAIHQALWLIEFFCLFGWTGVWTQGFMLQSRWFATWAMLPVQLIDFFRKYYKGWQIMVYGEIVPGADFWKRRQERDQLSSQAQNVYLALHRSYIDFYADFTNPFQRL
jgi:hypothetical protein